MGLVFLRAHSAITRQLNADLLTAHGLTLHDYEVLLRLSAAEQGMMRRVDLAESVELTATGITLVCWMGSSARGWSRRPPARPTRASPTPSSPDAGRRRLRGGSATRNLAGVDELFTGRFSGEELETLAELFSRLPLSGKDCLRRARLRLMPVYWKPRYPTRVMRERAFATRSLAREQMLRRGTSDAGSLLERLRRRFRRA